MRPLERGEQIQGSSGGQSGRIPATLALADGSLFRGYSIGALGETSGEVVFNTSMSGYQEILTDPSYSNQILTFTYPHIGNVGVNREDVESARIQVSGVVVRDLSNEFSNYRGESSLGSYLIEHGIVGIGGIDTRALVLHIRTVGAQMGVIGTGGANPDDLVAKARAIPSLERRDLVPQVTTRSPYRWSEGSWRGNGYPKVPPAELEGRPLCVAIDFGIKYNILRLLTDVGFQVEVVPATLSSVEILARKPAAVFLSNGPGDPAAVSYGITTTRELLGRVPMFGICLGHQILALAAGMRTYKLKFGHRGANHPVRCKNRGKVEITVQNHGFAVDGAYIPSGVQVTHMNLNDETVEGLEIPDARAFAVQYHPESSPGPHDSNYLFRRFREIVGG